MIYKLLGGPYHLERIDIPHKADYWFMVPKPEPITYVGNPYTGPITFTKLEYRRVLYRNGSTRFYRYVFSEVTDAEALRLVRGEGCYLTLGNQHIVTKTFGG